MVDFFCTNATFALVIVVVFQMTCIADATGIRTDDNG